MLKTYRCPRQPLAAAAGLGHPGHGRSHVRSTCGPCTVHVRSTPEAVRANLNLKTQAGFPAGLAKNKSQQQPPGTGCCGVSTSRPRSGLGRRRQVEKPPGWGSPRPAPLCRQGPLLAGKALLVVHRKLFKTRLECHPAFLLRLRACTPQNTVFQDARRDAPSRGGERDQLQPSGSDCTRVAPSTPARLRGLVAWCHLQGCGPVRRLLPPSCPRAFGEAAERARAGEMPAVPGRVPVGAAPARSRGRRAGLRDGRAAAGPSPASPAGRL